MRTCFTDKWVCEQCLQSVRVRVTGEKTRIGNRKLDLEKNSEENVVKEPSWNIFLKKLGFLRGFAQNSTSTRNAVAQTLSGRLVSNKVCLGN